MTTIKPWRWAVRETVGNMWGVCDSEVEAQETAAEWRVDGFEAEVVPLYDPAGVAAAVAAERKRCATLCLSRSANGNYRADSREDCAALIRGELG
jgi:hypothetical protein